MTFTEEALGALIAAIDSGDQDGLRFSGRPAGANVKFAARACRRARESSADAIATACEGDIAGALVLADEAERHLGVMRRRLTAAIEWGG